MNRKWIAGLLAAALALPMAGCYEYYLFFYGHEAAMRFLLVGEIAEPALVLGAVTKTPYEGTLPVDIEVSAGGLSGNYGVTIFPQGTESAFGSFEGTGVVKRGRFVTIKGDETDANLVDTVEEMVAYYLEANVDLTRVRAKVTAYQTPGGVEAGFRCTVTFSGNVVSGPNIGRLLKKGKITMEDIRTPDA